ncbi:hypothetical protein AOLI_G00311340 [Acnodon oligacanthus]
MQVYTGKPPGGESRKVQEMCMELEMMAGLNVAKSFTRENWLRVRRGWSRPSRQLLIHSCVTGAMFILEGADRRRPATPAGQLTSWVHAAAIRLHPARKRFRSDCCLD